MTTTVTETQVVVVSDTEIQVVTVGIAGADAPTITAKNEGTTLTTSMTSIDFVGSGVNATNVAGAVTVTISGGGGGGGLSDGDYGDITVAGGGTTMTIDNGAVTLAKTSAGVQTSLGKADTALQSGSNISLLTNNSGYITASSTSTLTNKSGNISQWTNDSGYITASALTPYVPYTGATGDVDLGANNLNAKGLTVSGTGGAGHIHLKHQSSDATATGSSTVLFANSSGDIKYKNDGGFYTTFVTSANTADRSYTFPDQSGTIATTAAVAAGYQPLAAVLTNTTASFTTALETKLNGIEALADVTDTANVTAAGALMDSELTSLSGVKTLTVPDNTTISAFGATLVDDADATAARTTLGLGTLATQSGTFSGTSSGTNTGDQTITLTGDVTGSGTGSFAATIAANAVTNAKLATVATATFKGRTTAGTGNVEDLTATQATALLDAFTSGAKGLAPASGGGTTNFLRADGTWATPSGGGDVTGAASSTDNALCRFDGTTGKVIQNSVAYLDDSGNLTIPNVNDAVISAASFGDSIYIIGSTTIQGDNTGDQNLFSTIAVSGQSNIVADSTIDTLTFAAGSGITITTNATTDTITIAATGGGSSPLTTKGDIYTYSTADARLPVGTNGQVLSADSAETTGLKWITPSGVSDGDKGDITVTGSGATWTIDNNAVTTAKINDAAVTTAKINDSAVTTAKINDDAITEAKLDNGVLRNIDNALAFTSNNCVGSYVTGEYYDQSFFPENAATQAGVANRFDLYPFIAPSDFSIDQIGVAVSTAVASAQAKVVVYNSGTDGWPSTISYEGGNLDCSATGYKSEAVSITFTKGVRYWVGVRHSSTATLRTAGLSNTVALGGISSGSTGTTYYSGLRRTLTYATAATSPWSFTASDLTNLTAVSIRMRKA